MEQNDTSQRLIALLRIDAWLRDEFAQVDTYSDAWFAIEQLQIEFSAWRAEEQHRLTGYAPDSWASWEVACDRRIARWPYDRIKLAAERSKV